MTNSGTSPEPRERRLDARRNLAAILESARTTLAEHPNASMQEVAENAGLHRATVHRHFASRDDLLRAVRERALDEALTALEAARCEEGPARDALRRATAGVLEAADRYRLVRVTAVLDPDSASSQRRMREILIALFERGQRDGDMRRDLAAPQLATAWGGLIMGFMARLIDGSTTVDDAAGFVVQVLLGPEPAGRVPVI